MLISFDKRLLDELWGNIFMLYFCIIYVFHNVYLNVIYFETVCESILRNILYRIINIRSPDQFKNKVVQIPDYTWLNIFKSASATIHHDASCCMINESIPTRHCILTNSLIFILTNFNKTRMKTQVIRAQGG